MGAQPPAQTIGQIPFDDAFPGGSVGFAHDLNLDDRLTLAAVADLADRLPRRSVIADSAAQPLLSPQSGPPRGALARPGDVIRDLQNANAWLTLLNVEEDPGMAEALGVNRKRLLTLVFGCAAGLAALAGALVAPIFAIHPDMGMNILIDSFLVVVLGGLGSLTGSVIGAFFVSLTKAIGGGYLAEWSTAFLFLVVAMALILRPTGIFGRGRVG